MIKKLDNWLPFILLTLVGICIFLTERQDGGAIQGSLFANTSAHGVTLSKNLMDGEHPFFMYTSRELNGGKVTYDAYNRFPVFPFLLTGILISPFENDTLQIYIARQLMNIFFFLSIIVVFMLVNELTKNKYLAISVAVLTFSSFYMMTYHNMIFNDILSLLGFVIAFYCVVLAQKNKMKKSYIILLSMLSISFGWQPYAVYLTWLLFDVIELLFKKEITIKQKFFELFKNASFRVTAIVVIWGVTILGLQLLNEWRIVGGSFEDLPSVSSGLWRSGLVSAEGRTSLIWAFDWFNYLPGQLHAMVIMLIPFWPVFQVEPGINASIFVGIVVMIFILLKFFKDKSLINKMFLIMIFSGFVWSIPMRHFVALHDFQSVFYIGFVISVFTLLLSRLNLQVWNLLAVNLTIAFLISVSLTNYYKAPYSNPFTKQFENIKSNLPQKSKVFFDGDRHRMVGYSKFALDLFLSDNFFTSREEAEFIISQNQDFNGKKITNNTGYNLFKSDEINP
ncbi:MAG: hypothetical protein EHM47_04055 [Ignavibacteriales bacterium]|nr:MAG: hypothetical protein EHM47_04055 [Ignavibacteriales bacterium]